MVLGGLSPRPANKEDSTFLAAGSSSAAIPFRQAPNLNRLPTPQNSPPSRPVCLHRPLPSSSPNPILHPISTPHPLLLTMSFPPPHPPSPLEPTSHTPPTPHTHKARHPWPPNFALMPPAAQFRLERRYRRRTKLAYTRPGWIKGVKLVQLVAVVGESGSFCFCAEGGLGGGRGKWGGGGEVGGFVSRRREGEVEEFVRGKGGREEGRGGVGGVIL